MSLRNNSNGHLPRSIDGANRPSCFRLFVLIALVVVTGACTSTSVPKNQPITTVEEGGYRRLGEARVLSYGDTVIILSFSGGGTRASALSYGVMQELRDTLFSERGNEIRALDAVDTISSVSGGSFTAAYYGAFRDRLFDDFEQDFLRRGVQSSLIGKLLRPVNWLRNLSPGVSRTETAVEYYDQQIFRGATFNDVLSQGPPYIEINATELATGLRFSFTQERFNLLCSDLGDFPLARAVTASSAVPGIFPSVVIKNYADQCDLSQTREWQLLLKAKAAAGGEAEKYALESVASYRDTESRQYIHLVDGGISDNLGLRAMIDRFAVISDYQLSLVEQQLPRNIVIILADAAVRRNRHIEQSREPPSLATTMATLSDVQMHRHNQETMDRFRDGIAEFEQRVDDDGMQTQVYFTEISFDSVRDEEISRYLNSLPTSLELEDKQVDRLIAAGRVLLRHDPSFSQFKQNNGGRLAPGAVTSDEMCRYFGYNHCPGSLD